MPADPDAPSPSRYWEPFDPQHPDNPWREVEKTFGDDPGAFRERYYKEFVTFLPNVQRFLYGDAPAKSPAPAMDAHRSAFSAATTSLRCGRTSTRRRRP